MSDEPKPAMPPPPLPKTTVELPAVPPWAIELTQNVKDLKGSVDEMRTAQQNQADATIDFGRRLTGVELRVSAVEERQASASLRAQAPSTHDLQAQAELAAEKTARESLANQVGVLEQKLDANNASTEIIRQAVTGIGGWLKQHPQLVAAAVGFVTAALGWGAHFFATGGH